MNMQVCVPYQKCPFNCPMCIANGRKLFDNTYKTNPKLYYKWLKNYIDNFEINDIVLTGATDPSLNVNWLQDTLKQLKGIEVNIELQTKNYNLKGYRLKGLDTLAYSIPDLKSYLKAWRFRKLKGGNNRLVILLTKEFEILNAENFSPMGYNQITFKVLQSGADAKTNKWVEENRLEDLTNIYAIVNKYNGSDISVRIDTNCQDSESRYYVYREDGNIYDSWESELPMGT